MSIAYINNDTAILTIYPSHSGKALK